MDDRITSCYDNRTSIVKSVPVHGGTYYSRAKHIISGQPPLNCMGATVASLGSGKLKAASAQQWPLGLAPSLNRRRV